MAGALRSPKAPRYLEETIARDLLPLVRQALGDLYTVDREIGRGGAARVYLAHQADGTTVALKILRPELLVSIAADRFLREIGLIARLDHPNIGRLLTSGERDWLVYYVMPYIEGPTLKQALASGPLPVDRTIALARDLLLALEHAHERHVIHRDVKPENIVCGTAGAVLLDFGIARAVALSGSDRLTRSGVAVGTSHYMSPEQVGASDDIDHRTDIYSLGCVLFECLAGRPPFTHGNETTILQMHRLQEAPDLLAIRPDLPPLLTRIVARALLKAKEDRWPTAGAMAEALAAL
ncbi:MAG: serine/threonine-protein kinase [Gemmatimonadota bacterium]